MKICYFDAFSGISGDMTVGALLDAGASFPELERALASLDTGAAISIERVKRKGISATSFRVAAPEQKGHRHLHHITRMIEAGDLPAPVKQAALATFQRLGTAEAKVHGVGIDKVHFHEVGALDSICDIVGAAFCLHDLGIEAVHA
ncbi:MAG TPA: nickel insertion protein, partial [Bryobacteraceae bacterium]|nr:nickel insertion protein [Bryobacteraceae bacterium]